MGGVQAASRFIKKVSDLERLARVATAIVFIVVGLYYFYNTLLTITVSF
jgi:hypothetical protein